MPDPKQLCYLCDRDISKIGKASDITDSHGNPIGRPGVCVECDEQHNPVLKALRRQQRQVQGGIQQPAEEESNPLNTKPGMKKIKKNLFQGFKGPSAPLTPPPAPRLPPADDEGGNPLNR